MNNTVNYRLKKPEKNEYYNVDDFNENADIIDKTLSTLSGRGLAYDVELHAVELGEGSGATVGGATMSAADKLKLDSIRAITNEEIDALFAE